MNYQNELVKKTAVKLMAQAKNAKDKKAVLRSSELAALYEHIKTLSDASERASFGKEVNALKLQLEALAKEEIASELESIDISAPFDVNTKDQDKFAMFDAREGTKHPLTTEMTRVIDIFSKMGFAAYESREIDDDYHMFTSLNFPKDHPARDEYDTFLTDEGLIAPAHTSTMQNRVLKANQHLLAENKPIAAVIGGRVFRNEDLDARHEHTFHQLEGIFVDKNISVGNLIATLKSFFSEYFQKDVLVRTQPFYFPFTEPSLEFAASCVFCDQKGCNICSYSGWIELLGCGLIHPNVLKEAGIDAKIYNGFAWGGGIERLVMLKYGIEDIRHFESGNLKFLRQFK